MPRRASDLWLLILAAMIASFLWLLAHRSTSIERGYDVQIAFHDVPEQLVVTDQSVDVVNIQVQGSRAALRQVSAAKMEYALDISGARPGPAVYSVDRARLDEQLPRGTSVVSRSPASIEVTFERRGRKSVKIEPDVVGEPAEGFVVSEVSIEPPRVWLVGARSAVLRLSEVVTDTVDVTGVEESVEREVGLSLGPGKLWVEDNTQVTVRVEVEPLVPLEEEGGEGDEAEAGSEA